MKDIKPHTASRRQVSVAGLIGYATLWAVIISLFRQAAKLQQGTYTIAESRLSDFMLLVSAGLLCVAIGLPVMVLRGKSRNAASIAFGCFIIGVLVPPIMVVILMVLAGYGLIDLD